MKLDEHYTIEWDAHSWNLRYLKEGELNEKTGKPMITHRLTYHTTIREALLKYTDHILHPCETITEVLNVLNEAFAWAKNKEKDITNGYEKK